MTIKGRELFRVPEPVQIVLFCLIGLLVAVLIWSVVMPREQVIRYAKARPQVYVMSHDVYTNLDNRPIYVLEYAIDGELQAPANFKTEREMLEFEGYLYRIGERGK